MSNHISVNNGAIETFEIETPPDIFFPGAVMMARKLYIAAAAGLVSLAASALGSPPDAKAAGDSVSQSLKPIVVNTWAFTEATATAWRAVSGGASALDAVEVRLNHATLFMCQLSLYGIFLNLRFVCRQDVPNVKTFNAMAPSGSEEAPTNQARQLWTQ